MEEMEEVERGKLCGGREWHLIKCRKPDSDLREGEHLILECVGQPAQEELALAELAEFRILAFLLADRFASEKGRWRVDFNGPALATRPWLHAHIKLPAGKDKLARLVG